MTIKIDGIIFSLQFQGGISVYFRELLGYLAGARVNVGLTMEFPVKQDFSEPSNHLKIVRRASRLSERFRDCRVDVADSVFHSSYYRCPSRNDIPTVVTVHDFIYEHFRRGPARWAHMVQKHAAIRQAQSLICISESTRDDLMNFVGVRSDQTVHVIPNGVSNSFVPVDTFQSVRPFMLFVGERRGYKNFTLALAGLDHLPDLELHCVGGGPFRDDEFSGCSESLRARVRHLGFVTDEMLNVAYNQAICLVYPSRYEGFGIPVVEAMKAGCPVVSVNCKAVVEVGGDALERLEDEDPRALAEAVLRLCDSSYRDLRVARGLERASLYDWGRSHEQTLSVYRSLSAKPL
jgi:mannosyltransferase